MAYDELLADRIRCFFFESKADFVEKRMMGGLCFMVDDKMCCGIHTDKTTGENKLMARVGPDEYEIALEHPDSAHMDFTGRSMKGFVFILEKGLATEKQLNHWLQLCLDFNPLAKSSKKK